MAAYPRKQTVVTFLICMVAVLGVSYYLNGPSLFVFSSKKAASTTTLAVKPVLSDVLPVNSDWKKQFTDTGTSNSASDTSFKPKPVAKVAAKPEVITATDKLGREFLTKYAELKQAGLTDDTASVAQVMGEVTAANLESLPNPKAYTQKNINVTANTAATMKAYSASVSYIINTFMPKSNELEIAVTAMEQNQTEDLILIDPVIKNYTSMISRLLATPVPEQVAAYHLDLINGLSVALYAAQSMRHVDTDPVQALAGISLEPVGLDNIQQAYLNLQNQYIRAGMQFGV